MPGLVLADLGTTIMQTLHTSVSMGKREQLELLRTITNPADIGGLAPALTEGDIVTIFSQYGNPIHVKLMRDGDTGKSRGFCFLKYEDQRSTVLAVDNFNGVDLFGKKILVDHAEYTPKKGEEDLWEQEQASLLASYPSQASGASRPRSRSPSRRPSSRRTRHRSPKHRQEDSSYSESHLDLDLQDPMKDYFSNKSKSESTRRHK